ncbi:hypothetical protein JW968_04775 [Candidatus Woesearchaeota archaeon]|nr:hypothetical protein [Candidatus Woesearchaeota archaeon]
MGKRGQITVFIIAGLILLIAFSIIIYITVIRQESEFETGKAETIEKAPIEVRPVSSFITDCIESVGKDGLRKLGMQGGYISLEEAGIISNPDPTSGKALKFYPDYEFEIPYWWHLSSPNSCSGGCEFDTQRPPLYGPNSIQIQLQDYMDKRLRSCLRQFEDFQGQGYIFRDLYNISTEVKFTEKDIIFNVRYPLDIQKGEQTYRLERFTNALPVKFLTIYRTGTKLTLAQANFSFLEKEAKNIISIYSGVDENKLPPIAASEWGPMNFVHWRKSEVREKVEDILVSFMPLFQIPGTRNYQARNESNIFTQGVYKLSDLAITGEHETEFSNMSVRFFYLDWWPIYFDLTGRGAKGELIMPEFMMNTGILPISIQRYLYYYDLSFPVVVEIYDHEAFNGEGYRFMFALEGNLRDNGYMNAGYVDMSTEAQQFGTMLCNYNMRDSGNITTETYDKITNEPVDEVGISYRCGDETCAIGFTEMNSMGTKADFTSKYPICLGGYIMADKFGYFSVPIRYDTQIDENEDFRIPMVPEKEITFNVLKKPVEKFGNMWTFIDTPRRLYDTEMAIVQIDKVKEDPLEPDFSTTGIFYGNQTDPTMIKLVPGKYQVDINLIYNLPAGSQEAVIIPEEERCEGGTLFTDCEKIILPEIVFNKTFPSGGLHMGPIYMYDTENTTNGTMPQSYQVDETQLWEVKASDLYQSKTVSFFAVGMPGSGIKENTLVYDDLNTLNQKDNLSKVYRNSLEPRWIR